MTRGFRDAEPDAELTGKLKFSTAAAYAFEPDFGSDDLVFIPKSQSTWVPDPESDDKSGTMFVRAWLAEKNGWER